VVLENTSGVRLEQSLRFAFKASSNQAEYEALIAGLSLAEDMGVQRLVCLSDYQLTVGQVNGSFQVKDPLLTAYYQKVLTMLTHFESVKIDHILRNSNSRAEVLSKVALGKGKGRYDTVIQITLSQLSVSIVECMNTESIEADVNVEPVQADWRMPILEAIRSLGKGQHVPDKALVKKVAQYVLIREDLYKRGFSTPLLK